MPMEKMYGLKLPDRDGLLGISDTDHSCSLDYGYGDKFTLPAKMMLEYLTNPPSCHANAWHSGRPYPMVDLASCELVEISYKVVPRDALLGDQ